MGVSPEEIFVFGPFRLEPAERRLSRDGRPVDLPPKVFDALVLLVDRAGLLVGKDEFHAALWPRVVVADVNLSKIIWSIRRVLADGGDGTPYIETVPKQGYRFVAPVQRLASLPSTAASPQSPSAAAKRTRPVRGRPNVSAVSALILLVLAVMAYALFVRGDRGVDGPGYAPFDPIATATAASGSIVLAPILRVGNDPPADVAVQLIQLLALDLPISESLRVAVPGSAPMPDTPDRPLTPADARALAAAVGARWIVSGSLAAASGDNDDIRVEFVVFDGEGVVLGSIDAVGDRRSPVALAADIGDKLRVVMTGAPLTTRLADLRASALPRDARQTTGYFQGRAAIQALDGTAARLALEPVVSAEPDFLPARLALAQAFDLVGAGQDAAAHARDLLKHSGTMTRELRLATEGLLAKTEGRAHQALETYSALNRFFPGETDYALAAVEARIMAGQLDEAAAAAADLVRSAPADARGHLGESRVRLHQGNYAAALEAADRAAGHARGEHWATFRGECLRSRAMALNGLDRRDDAHEALIQAKALHQAAGNDFGVGKVDALLGIHALRDGMDDEAVRYFRSALVAFTDVDAKAQRSFVQLQLAQLEAGRGNRTAQRSAVDAAVQLARESGDLVAETAAMQDLAEMQLRSGEVEAAIANRRELLILHRRLDLPRATGWALLGLGHALYHAGRLQEAQEYATQALQLASRHEFRTMAIGSHTLVGLIAHVERRFDDAWNAHSAALDLSALSERPRAMAEPERELARVALDRGDIETAAGLLERAARRIEAEPEDNAIGWLEGLRVRLLIAQRRLPEARAALGRAQRHLHPDLDAWSWFPMTLHEAELLVAEGRPERADALLGRAIDRARTLNLGLFVDVATSRREDIASRHDVQSIREAMR